MTKAKDPLWLTREELHRLMHYDPETGVFVRLVRQGNAFPAGSVAGGLDGEGYHRIHLCGRTVRTSRLAWLYMKGEWPPDMVDHRNLQRDDNRWSNLRLATNIQNAANSPARKRNTSGFKGVYFCKITNRWMAYLAHGGRKNRKNKYLGHFDAPEEASAAYIRAAQERHGEYARSA